MDSIPSETKVIPFVRVETDNRVFELMQIGKEYVIDSREVAKGIGIEHESLIKTLKTYQEKLEKWGVLRFQIGKPVTVSGGRPENYIMLNRNQALFAITLSRNTEQVVEWKMALIEALDTLSRQPVASIYRRRIQTHEDKQTSIVEFISSHGASTVRDIQRKAPNSIRQLPSHDIDVICQELVTSGILKEQKDYNGKIYVTRYAVV